MAVIGWILLGIVGVSVAVIVILLATPLHLRLEAEAGDAARLVVDARTLWGLSPRLRLVDTDRPREATPRHREKAKKTGRDKRDKGWSMPGGRAAMWRLAEGVPGLLRGELARIHLDRVDVEARFGTGDPADTGRLYGLLTPLVYAVPHPAAALRLTPDFTRRCLEGHGEAALHLTPVALTCPVIRLVWNVYVRPRWR